MADLGFLGAPIWERWGGSGMDYVSFAILCEELERADTAFRVVMSVHVGLNSLTLMQWATEEQKQRWLVPQARGEKLAERALSQGELINRENLAKSLVAARDIPAGTVVAESDVAVKSPGQGLSPLKMPALIGRRLNRAMARDDYFFQSDLADGATTARRYRFDRPWGVPVRYHDTQRFLEICQPDIIEFHLSYSDMERDPAAYLSGTYDLGFVVHAPELFAGSKLMDLATADEGLRRYSLEQTQAVIDITRGLKKFFPKTKRPPIVANIGGFTMDEPLSAERKAESFATRSGCRRANSSA